MYSKEISKMDTSFHQFWRRNSEGWAMRTPGLCEGLPWTKIQLEDMESYAFNLEHLLRIDMDATDDAKRLLQEREEKIEQLEDTIQKLKDKKKSLEAANDKLSGKAEDQETQIAGLQGQCAYLNQHLMKYNPWPTKEETPLAIKDKELTPEKTEEDPEEREMCQPNGEDDPIEKSHEAPSSLEVKLRKTGNRKAYLARFN
jgi:DNA repair exonuclease SbcCD ATPase subunit